MKKKIFAILSALFLIITLLYGNGGLNIFQKSNTVFAVGDLTVDWGIGTGNRGPIFNISQITPGQSEDRTILVINGASTSRPVGIKALKTGGFGDLEQKLDIVISDGINDVYGGNKGPKTVKDFFNESSGSDFINLINLAPSLSQTFNIKVALNDSSETEFQSNSVIFNIVIGMAMDVPAECSDIALSPNTIFGTARDDRINGTAGNDLIFALEGNDKVYGKGGDDCIVGGDGNDQLWGETGNDIILGEQGNDTCSAEKEASCEI